MRVSRILHAGYFFEHEGVKIAFDIIFENPFSRNCHAFPDVRFDVAAIRTLKLDAVFISHHHDDHCSFESLALLDRAIPIYQYCLHEEMFIWLRRLGFQNVHPLKLDEPIKIGSISVTPRRALDADTDSIFHVEAGGINVLNVVDSWIDDETLATLAKTRWDLVLWPFQTMRELEVLTPHIPQPAPELPHEWIEQLKVLKPRHLVPSSCQFRFEEGSWYNRLFFPVSYKYFGEEIARVLSETRILKLNPGQSVAFAQNGFENAAALPWITPVGDPDLDYAFDPQAKIPSTAEIARGFAKLTSKQQVAIEHFLHETLPQRLRELGPSSEPFFQISRRWRLSVFDCEGIATHHDFFLNEEHATRATHEKPPEWLTEIPARRLFGAIHEGESLTSIYVRIKPGADDVDILEDPLLRALFNGIFGAYQRAQLEKLLGAQV